MEQPLKGMFNISGKEKELPRRDLDNTESYSVFIFPHVSTTEVLNRSDVQMYRTLLSVDTYLLIAQIIGCLFACTVWRFFLVLNYLKELLESYNCANVPRKWCSFQYCRSVLYATMLRILHTPAIWHTLLAHHHSTTVIQPNESAPYNAEIEFVNTGYLIGSLDM